jgi:hypothetical protein
VILGHRFFQWVGCSSLATPWWATQPIRDQRFVFNNQVALEAYPLDIPSPSIRFGIQIC